MAKVSLWGGTYQDVPALVVPDGDGGTSTFYENGGGGTLIQKTVTQNGTYSAQDDNADGYSEVTVNVEGGGGGGGSVSRKAVNFFDYDGTLLYSYTAAEALALTALPENPSHSGLTAQGWNWSLVDMKEQVTAMGVCDIGQMYVTDDGKTRLYCHFEAGRLSPYLGVCPNGTVVVDWGDGSATNTLTGSSLTVVRTVQHKYAEPGDYVITLDATSGKFAFYGVGNTAYILRKANNTSNFYHRVYAAAIRHVELGPTAKIGNYAFNYCMSLETITMHSDVSEGTYIGSYAFNECRSLKGCVLPSNIKKIDSYTFYNCSSLNSITMPFGLTDIENNVFQGCSGLVSCVISSKVTYIGGNSAFANCYCLKEIRLPQGVKNLGSTMFTNCQGLVSVSLSTELTGIGSSIFTNCVALVSLDIPTGITSIPTNAFSSCYGMAEYHFRATTPPMLSNTNAFASIQSDCKIYVPYSEDHSILEAYKTATNWSTYSSYMEEEAA